MGLNAELLNERRTFKQVALLVGEISPPCQADVWERVRERVFDMDLTEARGYVRARAVKVVRRQVAARLPRHPQLDAHAVQQLKALVTERVAQRILADLLAGGAAARRPAA